MTAQKKQTNNKPVDSAHQSDHSHEKLAYLAAAQKVRIDFMKDILVRCDGSDKPLWAKALHFLNVQRANRGEPDYELDERLVSVGAAKIAQMKTAGTQAHLDALDIEYTLLLPADPCAAIYVDGKIDERVFRGQSTKH